MKPIEQMAVHAAAGQFALQYCRDCQHVQYPPRELCEACLSEALGWQVAQSATGELLATTELHHSLEPAFRPALPLPVALVRLEQGPRAVCFLAGSAHPGGRVLVTASIDASGRAILTAAPTPAADPPHTAAATPSR